MTRIALRRGVASSRKEAAWGGWGEADTTNRLRPVIGLLRARPANPASLLLALLW